MESNKAWIQVVCYLLGYGCCAVPGALFIKKYTYKSGVMLGLGLYAFGALLFYPAMLSSGVNVDFSFFMYLLGIFVLFAGLSVESVSGLQSVRSDYGSGDQSDFHPLTTEWNDGDRACPTSG